MRIGVVVHGPQMLDSGYAVKILDILRDYGTVKARLGGTMGRTAVIDAELEATIDISQRLLPSQSIDKFLDEDFDVIFLLDYGKSSVTGHAFGYKVSGRCKSDLNVIQIERPGEQDGSVVPWGNQVVKFAGEISRVLGLKIVTPEEIKAEMKDKTNCRQETGQDAIRICRKIAGVSPDENIFLNGIVVGRSTSSNVTLVAENGVITSITGGNLKKHGVEKLGEVDLENAIVKTGLLRRSKVKPRILKPIKYAKSENTFKWNVAYLNHAADDIYKLRGFDMVVTVGDDTTLVAADILYRFNVPIIGITDGDLDKVVEQGFKTDGSLIVELESGWDDVIGEKIFLELFNGKESIEIENIENFKKEILQIISSSASSHIIKYN
ncbi:DUF2117 domain-containing protein [Methanobacterium paludis]|uniref:Uncharacterized conserved protein UCP006598 n=1 Tax=Methanobacterium paludis (strain DSM 25820 / JCM 18151 / SWAN1) TaxID=868131 RepID=F6D270_METPW|nr:DUF2117 domain-containing protein [Methanobacterium paludis]AEG18587.1 Uncharacterized conserved protein UCP006598 [Methanobacterium paludis]